MSSVPAQNVTPSRLPGQNPPGAHVLVVEDDPSVAEVVGRYLAQEGFMVAEALDGPSALSRATAVRPDLVVLDLSLPGLDGLEVLRDLRATAQMPVVILTARGEESDRVQGLELGADDYVVKPFSPRELVARVRAVLRRASGPAAAGVADMLSSGDLEVDRKARQARLQGRPVALTAREFDLLVFLMTHRGRVCSRNELLEQLWGTRHGDNATLTVHVRRLREKIEADPSAPERIKTVWGIGYRFDG